MTAVSRRSSRVRGLSVVQARWAGGAHSSHRWLLSPGCRYSKSADTHTVRVHPAFEQVIPAFRPGNGMDFGIASICAAIRSPEAATASIHGMLLGEVAGCFISTRSRCSAALNRRARSPHVRGGAERLPTFGSGMKPASTNCRCEPVFAKVQPDPWVTPGATSEGEEGRNREAAASHQGLVSGREKARVR